jgi:hypothetical protein
MARQMVQCARFDVEPSGKEAYQQRLDKLRDRGLALGVNEVFAEEEAAATKFQSLQRGRMSRAKTISMDGRQASSAKLADPQQKD